MSSLNTRSRESQHMSTLVIEHQVADFRHGRTPSTATPSTASAGASPRTRSSGPPAIRRHLTLRDHAHEGQRHNPKRRPMNQSNEARRSAPRIGTLFLTTLLSLALLVPAGSAAPRSQGNIHGCGVLVDAAHPWRSHVPGGNVETGDHLDHRSPGRARQLRVHARDDQEAARARAADIPTT